MKKKWKYNLKNNTISQEITLKELSFMTIKNKKEVFLRVNQKQKIRVFLGENHKDLKISKRAEATWII